MKKRNGEIRGVFICSKCATLNYKQQEVFCWNCGEGEMLYVPNGVVWAARIMMDETIKHRECSSFDEVEDHEFCVGPGLITCWKCGEDESSKWHKPKRKALQDV